MLTIAEQITEIIDSYFEDQEPSEAVLVYEDILAEIKKNPNFINDLTTAVQSARKSTLRRAAENGYCPHCGGPMHYNEGGIDEDNGLGESPSMECEYCSYSKKVN